MSQMQINKRYVYDNEKDQIGRGGFAVVYRGRDTVQNCPVAIKKLLFKEEYTEPLEIVLKRFKRESEILRKLEHPYIIPVYDSCRDDNDYYIVMEYADRESWRTRIDKSSVELSVAEIVDVGIAMCKALAKAHEKKVIHRDITPQNILLVTAKGQNKMVPKLTDFGLARDDTLSSVTKGDRSDILLGNLLFMPPEAYRRTKDYKPDERRDVYGLGATLYYALTKQAPFPDPQHISRKDIPPWLDKVIFKALAPALEDRYSNMDEMLKDLENGKKQEPSSTSWDSPIALDLKSEPRGWLDSISRPLQRLVIVGGIIIGIAIALVLMFSIRTRGVTPPITTTSSPTITITASPSATATSTATITPSQVPSQTPAPSVTLTFTSVPSLTPAPTVTNTPTRRPTPTPTWTPSPTPTEKPPKPGGGKCPPDC